MRYISIYKAELRGHAAIHCLYLSSARSIEDCLATTSNHAQICKYFFLNFIVMIMETFQNFNEKNSFYCDDNENIYKFITF